MPLRLAALLALILPLLLGVGGCTGIDGDDGGEMSAVARASQRRVLPDMPPEQLMGLDADRLTATLGPADFQRADGPAEIWQYRDQTCVLDLFLYADGPSGAWKVEHVEARDRAVAPSTAGGTAAVADCPRSLIRERRQQAN